jgi:glycosyltransferase involved in cell wall biosynthesis
MPPERAGSSIRLGIVANEMFAPEIGRMGGFGWAVRQVSECFAKDPSLGVDVTLIMGEWLKNEAQALATIHGSPVIWREKRLFKYLAQLRRKRFDVLLAIDYRPNFRRIFYGLPRTPVLIWVRDPRDADDVERVRTLRIPGAENRIPYDAVSSQTTSLSQVVRISQLMRRPVSFAVTSRHLEMKIPGCYGVEVKPVDVLPNIISLQPSDPGKSKDPLVVFLGRLDPIKRPWIFAELAKRFPGVQFLFMGQKHFQGPGAWDEGILAPNVRMLGHIGESDKTRLLSSAWVLINSSIHEALSISFLEALACETPIISSLDPDGLVSRFGIHAVNWPGTGLEGLPAFESALQRLLGDEELRRRLGREGRAWVNHVHNRIEFLAAFRRIIGAMSRTLHNWANGSQKPDAPAFRQ